MTPETCTTSNTQRTDRDGTTNVALLPCPHCGGRADCDREPWPNSKIFSIWCSECKAGIDQSVTDANLLEAWNRRAAPTLPADVKGLVGRLQRLAGSMRFLPNTESVFDIDEAIAALTSQSALLDSARQELDGFANRFDEIRLLLVHDLKEPQRTAFWKAVKGKEDSRHAASAMEGRASE